MDIMGGEKQKKLIQCAVYLLRKKLGSCATAKNIHNDMGNCGNPAIKRVNDTIQKYAQLIEPKYQRNMTSELSELGLWILYKDTAYRDVFFCILADLMIHSDELLAELKPYIKKPHEWYPNVWWRSRKRSKDLKDSGKIPPYAKSHEESIFTPTEQNKRLNRIK